MNTKPVMPTILAIETSTSACSVALLYKGHTNGLNEVGNNIHSGVLLNMVDELLGEAGIAPMQLDGVAVGQGPGSFTGLRIGVGVAQGIAYGAACKMIGVSSLETLAQAFANSLGASIDDLPVLAGIDARMGEIYWAEFAVAKQRVKLVGELTVSVPEQISCSKTDCHLVGNAWSEYWDDVSKDLRVNTIIETEYTYPSAIALLTVAQRKFLDGETIDVANFMPIYVRNDVAKKSTKPLPGKRV